MPAHVIMLIGMAITVVPLVAVIAWIASIVAFENGGCDRGRLTPKPIVPHPELHDQLRSREKS